MPALIIKIISARFASCVTLLGALVTLFGCYQFSGIAAEISRGKAKLLFPIEFRHESNGKYVGLLPAGKATFGIFIENYYCLNIPDITVSLDVNGHGVKLIREKKRLVDFMWSHGRDSCGAFGYIREENGSNGTNISIKKDMEYEVTLSSLPSAGGPIDSTVNSFMGYVWVIYDGHEPARFHHVKEIPKKGDIP
jgi:hypothetical protein